MRADRKQAKGQGVRAHLLAEGPLEQGVIFPPHHNKEQGEVSASARAIAVQVQPQTHLVAVLTGIEC